MTDQIVFIINKSNKTFYILKDFYENLYVNLLLRLGLDEFTDK